MLPSWLPLALLAFVLAVPAVRTWAQQRRSETKIVDFGSRSSVQRLAGRHWTLMWVLALFIAALAWLAPEWEAALGRIDFGTPVVHYVSAILFAISAVVILVAQMQMGSSWRVGVPKEGPGALVTHGLFAWSRNPTFFGMVGAMVALFLWSPHVLTAAVLTGIWMLALVQVRIEEDAMRETHGDAYEHYAAHVGRWFGRQSFHRC